VYRAEKADLIGLNYSAAVNRAGRVGLMEEKY
jgi:hypothetical protein